MANDIRITSVHEVESVDLFQRSMRMFRCSIRQNRRHCILPITNWEGSFRRCFMINFQIFENGHHRLYLQLHIFFNLKTANIPRWPGRFETFSNCFAVEKPDDLNVHIKTTRWSCKAIQWMSIREQVCIWKSAEQSFGLYRSSKMIISVLAWIHCTSPDHDSKTLTMDSLISVLSSCFKVQTAVDINIYSDLRSDGIHKNWTFHSISCE